MTTFNSLLKEGFSKNNVKCNFSDRTPDGCWSLQNDELAENHLLCVSFESAIDDLPKLIIDAYINRHNKIPTDADLSDILSKVKDSMSIAVAQGKVP